MPEVSVILPAYNAAPYVERAVRSILDQTFADLECIVVDDGSTDDTFGVLSSIHDDRLRLLRHDANRGLIEALNTGLAAAAGEWVARMDADDMSERERFSKQLAYLKDHPDVDILGCRMREVDAAGTAMHVFWAPEEPGLVAWRMLFETSVAHATTMMRRSLIQEVGGYDPDYPHVEDLDLWSRLWGKARFANLSDELYVRQWVPGSICGTHAGHQQELNCKIRAHMWGELLGSTVSEETLSLFDEQRFPVLDRQQMTALIELILSLYDAFQKVPLYGGDTESVHADLADRLIRIAQRNGYVHPNVAKNYWKRVIPKPLRVAAKRLRGRAEG
jgi:glycosyltransferase involved in cell wall biosynthesis